MRAPGVVPRASGDLLHGFGRAPQLFGLTTRVVGQRATARLDVGDGRTDGVRAFVQTKHGDLDR